MPGAFTAPTFSPNALAVMGGLKPQIQAGPWVTAGGAATLVDLGYLSKVEVDPKRVLKKQSPENRLGSIGGYYTEQDWGIKADVWQHEPANLALLNGDASSQVVTVARTPGTVDGTVTYGLADPGAAAYLQVVLTAKVNCTIAGVTYTYWQITLWRVICAITGPISLGKASDTIYKAAMDAFADDSVTGTTPYMTYGKSVFILPA